MFKGLGQLGDMAKMMKAAKDTEATTSMGQTMFTMNSVHPMSS